MKKLRRAGIALALAFTSLAGCATIVKTLEPILERTDVLPQAERIEVYETTPPGSQPYRYVKRLWVESRRSAFVVPRYASVEAGAADLRNHAAALGGDAIVNFGCYHIDPTLPRGSRPALICNGTVIKYAS